MTGQSLYYLSDADLKPTRCWPWSKRKAQRAPAYALKLLQTEGELTIASTGKDPETGRMVTQEYHVEGPVMMFLTTTAIDIDEELLNRCLVLTVNEEPRADAAPSTACSASSETLEGLLARQEGAVLRLHRNAQRLLKPLAVVNPYARATDVPGRAGRARGAIT